MENDKITNFLQIVNGVSGYWYVKSDASVQTNKNLLTQ